MKITRKDVRDALFYLGTYTVLFILILNCRLDLLNIPVEIADAIKFTLQTLILILLCRMVIFNEIGPGIKKRKEKRK